MDAIKFSDRMPTEKDFPIWVMDCCDSVWYVVYESYPQWRETSCGKESPHLTGFWSHDYDTPYYADLSGSWYPIEKPPSK